MTGSEPRLCQAGAKGVRASPRRHLPISLRLGSELEAPTGGASGKEAAG